VFKVALGKAAAVVITGGPAIVIEKANGNYSAYVPALPGCVATGDTVDEHCRIRRDVRRLRLH